MYREKELDELIKLTGELYGKLKAYKQNLSKKEEKKEASKSEDIDYFKEVMDFFDEGGRV